MHPPIGRPPHFDNLYVVLWSFINLAALLVLCVVVVLIIRYFKNRNAYRQQVLNRMDSLILLLKNSKEDNDLSN